MPKIRRGYKGAAVAAALNGGGVTSATQTSISLSSSPTTFPTGKFFVVVAPGTAQEEKMCVTLSGSTLTVVDPAVTSNSASVNGRGVDNTTARSAIAGGAAVYPVATAIDFDEANELTSKFATQGSLVYQGATTFAELPIGTAGYVLKVNSGATAPEWGQLSATALASNSVTPAKLDATVAGDGLGGAAGSPLSVNVDGSTIEISSDALRVKDSGITTAKLDNGSVTEDKLASSAVTTDKIADGAILNADINASAGISLSKLATGASGQIIVHNALGVPTAVAMSGDATVAAGGTVTIANNAITEAKIADGAVAAAKFKSGIQPVYLGTSTTGMPTTDGTVAYVNSGDSAEGIQTYNGSAWNKSWNMPWGVVAYAQITADSSSIGNTTTDVTGLSTGTVSFRGNRRYRISTFLRVAGGGNICWLFIRQDTSTEVSTSHMTTTGGYILDTYNLSAIYSPTSTTSTSFKVSAKTNGAGQTMTVAAASTYPAYILVEDLGPFGAPV